MKLQVGNKFGSRGLEVDRFELRFRCRGLGSCAGGAGDHPEGQQSRTWYVQYLSCARHPNLTCERAISKLK